jgi:hypothetical protein
MELSHDISRDDVRPYFLWDTRMTGGELRARLREAGEEERLLWIGRILREARYPDVWAFLSVDDVASRWDRLRGRLGRKNAFWEFLITRWRGHGLIPSR